MSVVSYSAVADQANCIKNGRYKLYFKGGELFINDGEKLIPITEYDPTVNTSMLPTMESGDVVYKLQTVLKCFENVISELITVSQSGDKQANKWNDLENHVEFREDSVVFKDDVVIDDKTVKIPGDDTEATLLTLEYYNDNKGDLTGYSAFEYYQSQNYTYVIRDYEHDDFNERYTTYQNIMSTVFDYSLFEQWQKLKYSTVITNVDYQTYTTRYNEFVSLYPRDYTLFDFWQLVNYNGDIIEQAVID